MTQSNNNSATATVAFVGLGNMGLPMAGNLVKAGFKVMGYDPSPSAASAASELGIDIRDSAADAVAAASVVITMLPSGRHVLNAYAGSPEATGLLDAAQPSSLFIDCSTIAVDDAREAARRAVAAGHRALDAPVSGGVLGAQNGALTLMVGASEGDFTAAGDVLAPMAGKVVHCGEAGAGQAAKICNNMILGISMVAVSEAFVLGEKLGLTHQALFDVASTASGQCWALTTNCPVPGPVPASPANRDYRPGFAAPLMSKDMTLAMQAASSAGAVTRVGAAAAEILRDFAADDGRDKDFSGVIEMIRASTPASD